MWRTTPCCDRILTVWIFGTGELVELVASAESNEIQYGLDMMQHSVFFQEKCRLNENAKDMNA